MGRSSPRKHYYRRNGPSMIGIEQRNISYQKRFIKIKKEDVRHFLIPVVKEIGKELFPPAAIPIEILYQIYDHADAIKEAGSAVMEGNYRQAAKIVIKEAAKEATEAGLEIVEQSVVEALAESSSDRAADLIEKNLQQKEVVRKVVKGGVKGVAEAINEELADKMVEQVIE